MSYIANLSWRVSTSILNHLKSTIIIQNKLISYNYKHDKHLMIKPNCNMLIIRSNSALSKSSLWFNGIVDRYSKPVYTLEEDDKTLDHAKAESKLLFLFPIILHKPQLDFETLYSLLNIYYIKPAYLKNDVIERRNVFDILKEKLNISKSLFDIDQLLQLSSLINKLKTILPNLSYLKVLSKILQSEVMLRCKVAVNLSDALKLCSQIHSIFGNVAFRSNNIYVILENFTEELQLISLDEALQILIYLSLSRDEVSEEFEIEIAKFVMQKIEQNINALSYEQVSDIVIAAYYIQFKFSFNNVDFNKCLLKVTKQRLLSKSSIAPEELHSFIGILKEIRYRKCYDDQFFTILKDFILEDTNNSLLSNECIPDILALMSLCNYYDSQLFNKYEEKILTGFKSKAFRIKEITRILWAFSHVGHTCSLDIIDEAVRNLNQLEPIEQNTDKSMSDDIDSKNNEYLLKKREKILNNYLWCVCDSCFSLAQFGYYPSTLISKIFQQQYTSLQGSKKHENYYKKLLILNELLKTYSPDQWNPDLKMNIPAHLGDASIDDCPPWTSISEAVQEICLKYKTEALKCEQLIPYMNSPSIVYRAFGQNNDVFGATNIAIDFVDDFISNATEPTGLIRIKHNLLKSKGWTVNFISKNSVLDFNNKNELVTLISDVLKPFEK